MEHSRPWLKYYSEADKAWSPRHADMLSAFRAAVDADRGGIRYFGNRLSWRDIDVASDRLAAWAAGRGVGKGDRVSAILQNVPSFAIAAVAAWKLGAVLTPANPMYKAAELSRIFADSTPSLVICHDEHESEVLEALADAGLSSPTLTVHPTDHAASPDPRVLPSAPASRSARALISVTTDEGQGAPPPIKAASDDLCLLLYTSGTTGVPKGAMLRHDSIANQGQHTGDWCGVGTGARILGIAPLFHITGFVCHLATAITQTCDLILVYRFEPSMVLDAIRREQPTFAIGAITAFNALASQPSATKQDFASFEEIYSGGAPIAPALRDSIRDKIGVSIQNCYGMTETAAPTHFTPRGVEGPVDPDSGALSIGVPAYRTDVMIADNDGRELPPGEIGELCLKGPQIMTGYWLKPEDTAATLVDGWMHSGDVGVMDPDGWFFLVDRKKDMINASGFKVWPREVEDALYAHPTVREAAVVGAPDPYRGETVIAYVSARAGSEIDAAELVAHCRKRLAAYKCPREFRVLEELPKTVTGKIQRNLLREREAEAAIPTEAR